MDTPGAWNLSVCPNEGCGTVWLNPAPVQADLHLAYSKYFTHAEDPRTSVGTPVRRLLYSAYTILTALPAFATGLLADRQRLECMFLNTTKPGRLLDVGCGDGKFLHVMQGRGWSVQGVDFDHKAISAAKKLYGLSIRQGTLDSCKFAAEDFDAITMSHVIEHVPDPLGLLKEAARLLRAGGKLVVTTPNPQSLGHKLFKEFWFGVDVPRHLNLFPPKALESLGRNAGFSVVRTITSAGRADTFLGASMSIRDAPGHKSEYFPPPSPTRTLLAAWLQYKEHFQLKLQSHLGEEAVLICDK